MKSNNGNININVNAGGGGDHKKLTFLSRVFKSVAYARWITIFKVWIVSFLFLASAIIVVGGYTIAKDAETVRQITQGLNSDSTQEEEEIRTHIATPRIQKNLSVLMYTLKADRAFIFELHNGKKNGSGLPFLFADMTYEETNEEKMIGTVAMKYQNIPLTLYKYPHHLQRETAACGDIEDIRKIDPTFASHIEDEGGKYLGMIYLCTRGIPIGFLCVSFHSTENIPNQEELKHKLKEYERVISQLLDLDYQMNKINRNAEVSD